VRAAAQADIQGQENRLLARLAPGDRDSFLRALRFLSALPPQEVAGTSTATRPGSAASSGSGPRPARRRSAAQG
jgi:hypothetical protein